MTTQKSQNIKVIHPILFGLYPVLFLMSANLGEIPFRESWRVLFIVSLVSLLLWFILKLILKNNQKAALMTTFLLIIFFVYGHLYNYLGQEEVFDGSLRRHRYFIPFFIGIILLSSWWIAKKIRDLNSVTQIFNLIGLVLVIFPIFQIASFEIRSFSEYISRQENVEGNGNFSFLSSNYRPDVYYIILDAYGREDILLDLYDYENSPFLDELREMGFYIADCSNSNYEKTSFSLSSSLNMNYIEALGGDDLKRESDGRPDLVKIRRLIVDNEIRRVLESNYYSTVAFQTGFYWTRWDNADLFYSYSENAEESWFTQVFTSINVFESLLLETSAGRLFLDFFNSRELNFQMDDENNRIKITDETRQMIRYNTVKFTLAKLEEIPASIRSPKFVFVHLVSPHEPFVFNVDGSFVSDPSIQENDKVGYLNQIQYLNQRILTIVDKIITTSNTPPVIIIQADHGPPKSDFTPSRLAIFNAYYLPNGGNVKLYSSITPVNSFRVVFDHYFGTQYGLLEDVIRNSADGDHFNFTIVPNTCEGN